MTIVRLLRLLVLAMLAAISVAVYHAPWSTQQEMIPALILGWSFFFIMFLIVEVMTQAQPAPERTLWHDVKWLWWAMTADHSQRPCPPGTQIVNNNIKSNNPTVKGKMRP